MFPLIGTGLVSDSLKSHRQIPSRQHQSTDFSCECNVKVCWPYLETRGKSWNAVNLPSQVKSCFWEEAAWCESENFDDRWVAIIQVKRLQFGCWDGSHNFKTYRWFSCHAASFFPSASCLSSLIFSSLTSTELTLAPNNLWLECLLRSTYFEINWQANKQNWEVFQSENPLYPLYSPTSCSSKFAGLKQIMTFLTLTQSEEEESWARVGPCIHIDQPSKLVTQTLAEAYRVYTSNREGASCDMKSTTWNFCCYTQHFKYAVLMNLEIGTRKVRYHA